MSKSLEHIGVLGMRWGHRKQDEDQTVLRKGDTVHHVTNDTNLKPGAGGLYVSYTKKDVQTYRTEYATYLRATRGIDKIFEYNMSAKKDLLVPSKKKKIEAFVALHAKDKSLADIMGKDQVNSSLFLALMRYYGHDKKDQEAAKYRKMIESKNPKDQEKAFNDFARDLVWEPKIRKKYYGILEKQGFNAMFDDFDMNGYSEKPLIVFSPQKTLKITGKELLKEQSFWEAATT